MKKLQLGLLFAGLCSMLAVGSGCGRQEAEKIDAAVVKDLQTAYNGESNAAAKYELYAKKAAEAGYQSVAALFRATSKSESIHAARHAKVLKSVGVVPQAKIELPKYVDVATSLKDGIKGETYELTTMYPQFIAAAKLKKAPARVLEAFTYALEAEKEHARIYTAALAGLDKWKAAGKTFYVCEVCGYTTDKKPQLCILCASPFEKFVVFK